MWFYIESKFCFRNFAVPRILKFIWDWNHCIFIKLQNVAFYMKIKTFCVEIMLQNQKDFSRLKIWNQFFKFLRLWASYWLTFSKYKLNKSFFVYLKTSKSTEKLFVNQKSHHKDISYPPNLKNNISELFQPLTSKPTANSPIRVSVELFTLEIQLKT